MKCCAVVCSLVALVGCTQAAFTPARSVAMSMRGGGLFESTGDKAENTANKAGDTVKSAAHDVKRAGQDAASRGRQAVDEAGNKVQRLSDDLRPEQIVPLAVGLVNVAQGLDMLLNPSRTNRFFDNSYVVTPSDKTCVAMLGARELIKGIAIAAIAVRGDGQSVRLANYLALGSNLAEEGVDQYVSRTEGYRATGTGNNKNLISAFRAIASAATAYTIWSLRGKPTPNY